jgi:hypothetical protein
MLKGDLFQQTFPHGKLLSFNEQLASAATDDDHSGIDAKKWTIRLLESDLELSLRGPFRGRRSVQQEMESDGWRVLELQNLPIPGIAGKDPVVSEMLLSRREEHFRLVLASEFSDIGIMVLPNEGKLPAAAVEMENRFNRRDSRQSTWLFSMQIESDRQADAVRRAYWFDTFGQFLSTLLKHWKASK